MRSFRRIAALTAAFAFSVVGSTSLMAEQVKIEGVHLCCGQCVKGAAKALTGITGVSDVKIAKDDETVTFDAKDDAAALAGLTALSKAGFYGKSKAKGPDLSVDATAKKSDVNISDVHLCCPACSKAVEAALKDVSGVKTITVEAKQGKVTLAGENISLADTLKALHEAGFHGTVK